MCQKGDVGEDTIVWKSTNICHLLSPGGKPTPSEMVLVIFKIPRLFYILVLNLFMNRTKQGVQIKEVKRLGKE